MKTINDEFVKQREEAMRRFMAAKARKQKRMAELEELLRKDYVLRTGACLLYTSDAADE